MKKLLVLLIACLALTLAACGDDDDDDGGGSSAGTTTTEQTDTGAAEKPAGGGGKAATVDIPEIAFDPADLTLAAVVTLAACGDDDDDDGGGSSAGTTTTEQTDTGAAEKPAGGGGKAATVDIPEIAFDPADLTVDAGTKVTWTNSDDLPHTVTKDGGPGGDFDSGNLEPGDTFELIVDVPGTVDYVCTIHPGQAGSITVK